MITVLVVDDQDLVRVGLRTLIDHEPDLQFVGEASDGHTAVSHARRLRPDVVLMDIRMPHGDGIEATRAIRDDPDLAGVRVVVLTTFELDEYILEALRAGASGFLVKNTPPARIADGIRVVAAGGSLLSPSVTTTVVRELVSRTPRAAGHPDLDELTPRELEVLGLVAAGLSNDEIARELVISPATARTHVSRTMVKLDARDRAQLVVYAYQAGIT